ncbi:glutathione S-transferase family protein [Entomohabitans teleogrylli]|uniref:glutathione S-transferase family protein n=1 Tax=Entomohabitans teleogrylli TaxID=1384589 RepID=UPI00073D35D1|nr:glutathione S-transferase [Entomohabitans teleogrylli]
MVVVHHLERSRSWRVLWMLEELGIPWKMVRYSREPSMLAPEALKKIHPLGKSPVIEDNGHVLAESAAILEYLQETYDSAQQLRPQGQEERLQYRFWLHYAEGSLMPPLLLKLVLGQMGKAPVPWLLRPLGKVLGKGVESAFLNQQLATHSRFIEQHLAEHRWFSGEQFSVADIQMSFPASVLLARGGQGDLPHLSDWLARGRQRPAWQRAEEAGGPFDLPG